MCRISGYKHLSFAAARALAESRDADFAVYLPPPAGHEPVLYREEAAGLSTPDFERLKENGVEFLLVRSDDVAQCEELVEARLGDLLTSPDVVPPEKAEVLHTVGSVLAEGLTGDPGDDQQVQRTSRYVDNVIQGLLDDPAVSPYVLQMAEYERSTASHMMIVSALAVVLGHEVYGADTQALKDLGMAGMLHDLGKLAISPQTLSKTTPLTRQEMRMIEQHPIESVRLLDDAQHLSMAARQMIIQHHERVDGQGYPVRVSGADLLQGSRILSIVDTFHAMIGRGFYHGVMTVPEAIRAIERQAARQFDADLVSCWVSLFSRLRADRLAEQRTGPPSNPEEGASRHEHRVFPKATVTPAPTSLRALCDGRTTVKCRYAGRLREVSTALDEFVAPLQELSREGLCLYTPHPLYQGEVVHARVKAGDDQVWVRGTVLWCHQQADHMYKANLRFLGRISESQAAERVPVQGMNELIAMQFAPRTRGKSAKELIRERQKTPRESALELLDDIAAMPRITRAKSNTAMALSMSGDPEVRLRAIDVLMQIRSRAARETLVQMLADPVPAVRKQALLAVGALKLIEVADQVQELVGDPDQDVAREAAGVLDSLLKPLQGREEQGPFR